MIPESCEECGNCVYLPRKGITFCNSAGTEIKDKDSDPPEFCTEYKQPEEDHYTLIMRTLRQQGAMTSRELFNWLYSRTDRTFNRRLYNQHKISKYVKQGYIVKTEIVRNLRGHLVVLYSIPERPPTDSDIRRVWK